MAFERDELRKAMIEAAERRIVADGTGGLRARTVAQDTGVSVGTVYNVFGSLNGLFDAVFADEMKRFEGFARAARDGADDSDIRGRLLALALAYLDYVRDRERIWMAMLAYNRERDVSEEYLALQTPLFNLVADVLVGNAQQDSVADPMLAARMLWSSVHGIVTMNYLGMVSDETRENTIAQVDLLVDLVLDGIARPEGASTPQPV